MAMSEQDEIFLLAKLNILEDLCSTQAVKFAALIGHIGLADSRGELDEMESQMRRRLERRAHLTEGDITRIDPLAVQREMLRQLGPIFERMKSVLGTS